MTERRFRRKRLLNWIPTPVTNRFASTGERLVAVLSRVVPNWLAVPATDDAEDVAAADVAKKLFPVIAEENRVEELRETATRWLVYTGNAYLLSGAERVNEPAAPDPAALEARLAEQGVTPEALAADPAALEGLLPQPEYRLYTDVISPFEVYVNQSVPRLEDQPRILIASRKDVDWVKATYGVEVQPDTEEDLGLSYLESLGHVTEDVLVADYAYHKDQKLPRVTVKRLWVRPTEEYPDGLYAVSAGGRLLEEMPLPKTPEGKAVVPLVHLRFDPVPGAHYGRTPMNDLVQKQIQRNQWESLIILMGMRMASPIWLKPEGVAVRSWDVGAPGSVLEYQALGNDKAAKPDRIPGEQIPTSVLAFLDKIDADFEELASTFEAIKGEAPFSGVPGVVVQQLVEQGLSRFGPAFRNIAEGWRQWMQHQLELFRLYATTPRTLRRMGENSRWKVEHFTAADLSGAVDVRIEPESTLPRSEQVEAAKTLEALQVGLLDPTNVTVRKKVLRKLGLSDMMEDLDRQLVFAAKENEAMAAGEVPQVQPFLDDHAAHVAEHIAFALSEEAERPVERPGEPVVDADGQPILDEAGQPVTTPPTTVTPREIAVRHIAMHVMIGDAEMTGAPAQPAGPGAPPEGAPGEGGSSALENPPAPPGEGVPAGAL